jgi:hypothetical protein
MSEQLRQLADVGQSIWLDNIRRSMFASGELQRLIGLGLRGMTSNPTIFEKAIGSGSDYDDQLRSLIGVESDPGALFEALAIDDIRHALDEFRPLYDSTDGGDGFVSLEVSPLLAGRHAGHGRRGEAPVGRRRPAQPDDQDSGDPSRTSGDHRDDRRGHQRERDLDLLGRDLRGYGRGLHRRHRAPRGAKVCRSTASLRWRASSSAASTPRSTACCKRRSQRAARTARLAGQGRSLQSQDHLPAFPRNLRNRALAAARGAGRKGCSARSGPARARRIPPIPNCSTSRTRSAATRSTPCRRPPSTRCSWQRQRARRFDRGRPRRRARGAERAGQGADSALRRHPEVAGRRRQVVRRVLRGDARGHRRKMTQLGGNHQQIAVLARRCEGRSRSDLEGSKPNKHS